MFAKLLAWWIYSQAGADSDDPNKLKYTRSQFVMLVRIDIISRLQRSEGTVTPTPVTDRLGAANCDLLIIEPQLIYTHITSERYQCQIYV